LFTLIAHVLKLPKIKNLAAALPIEEQGTVEHDGDEMLSNITLLKQGAVPKMLFKSTPPLKNNPAASEVPVLGLGNSPGTLMVWSFTSPHKKLLWLPNPVPLQAPLATFTRVPLSSHAVPLPLHCH
jgi:hypothetical protein